eukprot:10501249-Heterocapsa_arctica.AAC.1
MAGPAVLLAGHATETWSILIECAAHANAPQKGAQELLPVSRNKVLVEDRSQKIRQGQDVSPGLPGQ